MEQRHRQKNRRQRLQVAADGHRLHRQAADGGEVAVAAQGGVHQAQEEDGSPVPRPDGEGKALAKPHEQGGDEKGGQQLNGGVFQAGDGLSFFVGDDHGRVEQGGHGPAEQAKEGLALLEGLSAHQHHPHQHRQKAQNLGPGEGLLKEQGGEEHDDHRPAVVGQGGQAHSDELVGLIEENPPASQGSPGEDQEEQVLFVGPEGGPGSGYPAQNQQAQAAQQGAEQDDFLAGEKNGAGHDAVGAEEKQREKIFAMGGVHGRGLLCLAN